MPRMNATSAEKSSSFRARRSAQLRSKSAAASKTVGGQAKWDEVAHATKVGGRRERTYLVNSVVLRASSIHVSTMRMSASSGVSALGDLCDRAEETYRCSDDRWKKTKDTAGVQPTSPCPPIKQAVFAAQRCWRFGNAICFIIITALPSWSWISCERRQRSKWTDAIVRFVRIRNCTNEFITAEELCLTSVHSF